MAIRDHYPRCWFNRNRGCKQNNSNRHRYKYALSILAVVFLSPAHAEDTTVSAQPQASISGSVANQAVQINQGSLSTQSYGVGHFCNGPVVSITPYLLRTESRATSYSENKNYGGQVSISFPLDGSAVELCKALARRQLEKQRLDYELVRIKECINIMKSGFTIHPESKFYFICSDVIPIAKAPSP